MKNIIYKKIIKKANKMHYKNDLKTFKNSTKSTMKVLYCGVTLHNNLGDLAQYYCIHNWIKINLSNYELIEIESDSIVNNKEYFSNLFNQNCTEKDIIICQSGYTTQDLGGNHNEMHKFLVKRFKKNQIVIFPQTVYFQKEQNELKTVTAYKFNSNVLFLARDKISYNKAKNMFTYANVKLCPDIVTTLIGKRDFNNRRNGILFCLRNDGEKFYTDDDILKLKVEFEKKITVDFTDTDENISFSRLRKFTNNHTVRSLLPTILDKKIEEFSKYKIIITDRYHGSIFSLIAGTPVLVIKTNDHKVISGVDWFRGTECQNFINYCDTLEQVKCKVYEILNSNTLPDLKQCKSFDNYYDKIATEIGTTINENI